MTLERFITKNHSMESVQILILSDIKIPKQFHLTLQHLFIQSREPRPDLFKTNKPNMLHKLPIFTLLKKMKKSLRPVNIFHQLLHQSLHHNILLEILFTRRLLMESREELLPLELKLLVLNHTSQHHHSQAKSDLDLIKDQDHSFNLKTKKLITQVNSSLLNLMELHHLVENNITELSQINLEKRLKRSS